MQTYLLPSIFDFMSENVHGHDDWVYYETCQSQIWKASPRFVIAYLFRFTTLHRQCKYDAQWPRLIAYWRINRNDRALQVAARVEELKQLSEEELNQRVRCLQKKKARNRLDTLFVLLVKEHVGGHSLAMLNNQVQGVRLVRDYVLCSQAHLCIGYTINMAPCQ